MFELLYPLLWRCSHEIFNKIWWEGKNVVVTRAHPMSTICLTILDSYTAMKIIQHKTLLGMYGSPRQAKIHHVIVHVMSRNNRADRFFTNNDWRCNIVSSMHGIIKTLFSRVMIEFSQTFRRAMQRIIHCSEWICKHVPVYIVITAVVALIESIFRNNMFNFCLPYRFNL